MIPVGALVDTIACAEQNPSTRGSGEDSLRKELQNGLTRARGETQATETPATRNQQARTRRGRGEFCTHCGPEGSVVSGGTAKLVTLLLALDFAATVIQREVDPSLLDSFR